LKDRGVKASFFLTGRFYKNPEFTDVIRKLKSANHYLGPHSDQHLLYADWTKRDSLLVTKQNFDRDLLANYNQMKRFGIRSAVAPYFLPPYEWYNDSIASWTEQLGLTLVNYTPGTLSHADYTTPADKNYRNTDLIYRSIINYENSHAAGLNGFMLLMHIGTDPARTDKFYYRLPELIRYLQNKDYRLVTVKELLD
jgi:endoglucanase